MANIASYLEQINNARYGKDVRSSIHDSIKAMNDQIETDVMAEITTAKTTALGAISSAQTTATNAIATDKGTALSAISSAKSDATGQIATDKKDATDQIAADKKDATDQIATDKADATDQIATDKSNAISAIEAKRVSSLASIPDDYTALGNSVNQLNEDLDDLVDSITTEKTSAGNKVIPYQLSVGTKIIVSPTNCSVNIFARETETSSNIQDLGFVQSGNTATLVSTVSANYILIYFTAGGSVTIENVDGRVTQLEFLKNTDVENIKYILEELNDSIEYNINLINESDISESHYWNRTSKVQISNVNACCYPLKRIFKDTTYYYKNLYGFYTIAYYDDGTIEPISSSTSALQNGSFTPTKDGLIGISVHTDYKDMKHLFTPSAVLNSSTITDSFAVPKMLSNVVYVGSGELFTNLRSAFEYAVQHKNCTVIVKNGTYDLLNEFAIEISNSQTSQYGIKLENGVHAIFASGVKVSALYVGTDQNVTKYFSPFYSGYNGGGFTLENLELHASNTRYCIHDDIGGCDVSAYNKYINCKLYFDNTTAPLNWYPQCIGGGFPRSIYVDIEGCYFKSKIAETNNTPLVSYHNSGTFNDSTGSINISDCYFADNGTYRTTWHGTSQYVSLSKICNCSLGASPYKQAETSSATIQNVDILSYCNEIR